VTSFNISTFAIIPPKKLVVKIKRIEADSDSYGDANHTCSRLQNFNSSCSLHVKYPELLKRNIYFYLCFWSLQVKYIYYVNVIFTSAKTRRFSLVSVRLVKHRNVPGLASADSLRDFF